MSKLQRSNQLLKITLATSLTLGVAMVPTSSLAQTEKAAQAKQETLKKQAARQRQAGEVKSVVSQTTSFKGCAPSQAGAPNAATPRDRITNAKGTAPKQRKFAGGAPNDVVTTTSDESGLDCWLRIDGVWRQESVITLDKSKTPSDWYSKEPDLLTLANGNYTTPLHIIIETYKNTNDKIALRAALGNSPASILTSQDGVSLKEALTKGGPRKVYNFTGPGASKATEVVIGMSGADRMRISYAGHTFVRPQPGVSQAEAGEQLRSDDAFLLSYNLKNLKANRQGYDVVTQDAFRLLDSDKLPIFADVDPQQYKISEMQIVPLGLTLIQENTQGTIYSRSLITSQSEYQKTVGHSFGASVDVGISDPAQTASASTSVGFSYTKDQTEGMSSSKAEMQAMGFSRSKRYAMVVDHPFVTLSNPFVEAIDDAIYSGNYDRIVARFGTHYAYAVTYGSVGKLTQRFDQNHIADFMAENEGTSFNAVASVSNYENSLRNSDTTQENENWTFVALGGNGSWDQSGFATGDTPYPILLDLRPLDQLLNPMNFPGQPEIYEQARAKLATAIAKYMGTKSNLLSTESVLPKMEKWEFNPYHLACGSAGTEPNNTLELGGTLKYVRRAKPKAGRFPKSTIIWRANLENARSITCPSRGWRFNKKNTVYGTRGQLRQYRFRIEANLTEYDYAGVFDPDDTIAGNSPDFGVPDSNKYPVGSVVKGSWRLPPGNENTHLGFHWTFKRLQ